jgi:hypothetical protein
LSCHLFVFLFSDIQGVSKWGEKGTPSKIEHPAWADSA